MMQKVILLFNSLVLKLKAHRIIAILAAIFILLILFGAGYFVFAKKEVKTSETATEDNHEERSEKQEYYCPYKVYEETDGKYGSKGEGPEWKLSNSEIDWIKTNCPDVVWTSTSKETNETNTINEEKTSLSQEELRASQEKPVLSLPFSTSYDPYDIMPMGETTQHPDAPKGHPGIDFLWHKSVPIVASLDGVVDEIYEGNHSGTWDIVVKKDEYYVGYTEMSAYNKSLSKGDEVETGDLIGYSWNPPGDAHYMIHWEFGWYGGRNGERLCPMTYFDASSKSRIEALWSKAVYREKDQFSYICSGAYQES